jgi:hypothetical protein
LRQQQFDFTAYLLFGAGLRERAGALAGGRLIEAS